MKKRLGLGLGVVFATWAIQTMPAQAREIVVGARLKVKAFKATPEQCSVTRFSLLNFRTKEHFKASYHRNTLTGMVIETSDPSCLENYGVVQYIMGCSYSMTVNSKTGQMTNLDFGRRDIGNKKNAPTLYPEWTVDTNDSDPLYGSSNESPTTPERRLDLYQVANSRLHLERTGPAFMSARRVMFNEYEDGKYYEFLKRLPRGSTNQMFTSDVIPGASYYPQGDVDQVDQDSFKFKTCLYHLKDIPKTGNPASFDAPEEEGGPVACLTWDDNTRFDFQKKAFTYSTEIDPVCTGPAAMSALREQ